MTPFGTFRYLQAIDTNRNGIIEANELINLFSAVMLQKALDDFSYDAKEEALTLCGDGEGILAHDLYQVLGDTWADPANEPELVAAEKYLGIGEERTLTQRVKEVRSRADRDIRVGDEYGVRTQQ